MKIIEVLLNVNSIEDAKEFYCNELNLFSFYYDYGMETISLSYVKNPTFRLTLHKKELKKIIDRPTFTLEIEDCDETFKTLQEVEYKTRGKLISDNVFEYPLGKSILIKDPSDNKFLLVENYYTNLSDD